MSMLYDKQTGVRTYKPYNVNGNWTAQVGYGLKAPLDKPRRLMLAFIPELTYTKSVDLTGTHGLLERSKVGTTKMEQFIELKYKLGKHLLTLSSENTWQHVNIYSRQKQQPSANQQNNSFSVADYKTSLSAQLKLPWKIELTTDLNLYNRRGYSDTTLNTSEWVWNGRISRSFLNGQLLMMLDGFDLLGQLSNISRAINAQGRTETWTNTQPRYVLLHAVWRWNHSPRKK